MFMVCECHTNKQGVIYATVPSELNRSAIRPGPTYSYTIQSACIDIVPEQVYTSASQQCHNFLNVWPTHR